MPATCYSGMRLTVDSDKPLLTVEEVASLLNCTEYKIRDLFHRAQLHPDSVEELNCSQRNSSEAAE